MLMVGLVVVMRVVCIVTWLLVVRRVSRVGGGLGVCRVVDVAVAIGVGVLLSVCRKRGVVEGVGLQRRVSRGKRIANVGERRGKEGKGQGHTS